MSTNRGRRSNKFVPNLNKYYPLAQKKGMISSACVVNFKIHLFGSLFVKNSIQINVLKIQYTYRNCLTVIKIIPVSFMDSFFIKYASFWKYVKYKSFLQFATFKILLPSTLLHCLIYVDLQDIFMFILNLMLYTFVCTLLLVTFANNQKDQKKKRRPLITCSLLPQPKSRSSINFEV